MDNALGRNAGLVLGGGLGLYLKQLHLQRQGVKTLLPFTQLPTARTTQDIDLFLRAEVVASKEGVTRYRTALDSLGFTAVPRAEWLKFQRIVAGTPVVLDMMVGPLGVHAESIRLKDSRARPKGLGGKSGLHAFTTVEALGIETEPLSIPLSGTLSDGVSHLCDVRIPRAFPYALMKLGALRDRVDDPNKDEGRHHAMDLYRVVGMLTEEEEHASRKLAVSFAGDPQVTEGLRVVDTLLAPKDGIGRVRLLEYQRLNRATVPDVDVDWLVKELRRLLTAE